MKTRHKYIVIGVGLICLYLIVYIFNRQMNKHIERLTQEKAVPAAGSILAADPQQPLAQNKIVRIERKQPGQEYAESIIFAGKAEIARFQSKGERITSLSGRIPDGRIKFINEWKGTYGYEHYKNGKREGSFREYYKDDQLKSEAEFTNGRLVLRKSYYNDGTLRTEEDYREGRFMANFLAMSDAQKAGKGKIYRSDGSLKYEWHMVDDAERNYTKSYNKDGELVEASYYDAQGNLLELWEPEKSGVAPLLSGQ